MATRIPFSTPSSLILVVVGVFVVLQLANKSNTITDNSLCFNIMIPRRCFATLIVREHLQLTSIKKS
jgi:hypothetical protein